MASRLPLLVLAVLGLAAATSAGPAPSPGGVLAVVEGLAPGVLPPWVGHEVEPNCRIIAPMVPECLSGLVDVGASVDMVLYYAPGGVLTGTMAMGQMVDGEVVFWFRCTGDIPVSFVTDRCTIEGERVPFVSSRLVMRIEPGTWGAEASAGMWQGVME